MKSIPSSITAALLATLAGCTTYHTVDVFTVAPAPVRTTYFPPTVELPFPTSTLAPINTVSDYDDYIPGYIPPDDAIPTTDFESDPVGMRVVLPADGPGADAGDAGFGGGIVAPLQQPLYLVQPVYIETPPTIIIQPEYIPYYQPPFFFGLGGDRDHRRPGGPAGDRNPPPGRGGGPGGQRPPRGGGTADAPPPASKLPPNFTPLNMPASPPQIRNIVGAPPAANPASHALPPRAATLTPRIAAPLPNVAAPLPNVAAPPNGRIPAAPSIVATPPAQPSMSTRLPAPTPRPSFAAPPVRLSVPSSPPPMPIVRANPPAITAPPPSPAPSVAPPPSMRSQPSQSAAGNSGGNSVQPAGRGR